MPGFDGTGPRGEGAMTGGARGYCNPSRAGYAPAYGRGFGPGMGRGFGRGPGLGYGMGRGYGRGAGLGWRGAYSPPGGWYGPNYYAPPPYGSPYTMEPKDEAVMLRDEANAMKSELDAINKRLEELEAQSPES